MYPRSLVFILHGYIIKKEQVQSTENTKTIDENMVSYL